jgi:peptidoglycan/xylan/chitin deacetylase (PgdA/CDA1 family)
VASGRDGQNCNCVIFRLDDVRNGYLDKVQISLMDFFISNNDSVSLGLIMNNIEDGSSLVQKIKEGNNLGLFELGIHGWDHVDYTKLSENEQATSIRKANEKMYALFGNYSKVFIPPFNLFDNDTSSILKNSHFRILSSAIYYDEPYILSLHKHRFELNNPELLHMPEMTDFSIYYNNTWVKVPIKFLLSDVDYDINTYGYSVIMIHPHNFATQINGSLTDVVDNDQIQSLANIVKAIKAKNLSIATLSETSSYTTD